MINARQHTEKLFIYAMLNLVLTSCYKGKVEVNEGTLMDTLEDIKNAELDKEKAGKNMSRAIRLVSKITQDLEGENGQKVVLATNHLFQKLINEGFDLFEPNEYGYLFFCELLAQIDTNDIGFDKRDRKAKKLAEQWRETLTKEGYFL